jgi:hypothetical protein
MNVLCAAKQCMCQMFHKDPAYRLTASEVLSHPWITVSLRVNNQRCCTGLSTLYFYSFIVLCFIILCKLTRYEYACLKGEEGEYRNVLEILKQFHLDGGGGGDEEDSEPQTDDSQCLPEGSSDPESRNGSAGSGGGETEVGICL